MPKRKQPRDVYHCEQCNKEICLADVIVRRREYGLGLCMGCAVKSKQCPKCKGTMFQRVIYYQEEQKKYWFCKGCGHGHAISASEGDKK